MTAYVGIMESPTATTVCGYSTAKTVNGVVNDIARIMKEVEPSARRLELTVEGVPCAVYWDEEVERMERDDGLNFHFITRMEKRQGVPPGRRHRGNGTVTRNSKRIQEVQENAQTDGGFCRDKRGRNHYKDRQDEDS